MGINHHAYERSYGHDTLIMHIKDNVGAWSMHINDKNKGINHAY